MLIQIAERLEALGPHFRAPVETIVALEAQYGRKHALEFAERHDDVAIKMVAARLADVARHANLLTDYVRVMSEVPPNARNLKRLLRRLQAALARAKASTN